MAPCAGRCVGRGGGLLAPTFAALMRQVQVRVAHAYLKDTLHFAFPELRAQAASAAEQARQQEVRASDR